MSRYAEVVHVETETVGSHETRVVINVTMAPTEMYIQSHYPKASDLPEEVLHGLETWVRAAREVGRPVRDIPQA